MTIPFFIVTYIVFFFITPVERIMTISYSHFFISNNEMYLFLLVMSPSVKIRYLPNHY